MLVKDYEEFTKDQQFNLLMQGTSYPLHIANEDKENYEKFKKGELEDISSEIDRDMRILSLLEKLGYPMNELGTYLYKDVIAEVYEFLKNESTRNDMIRCKEKMSQLNDAFSIFYHNIAREDKDMGVKSFHLYIMEAIEKIDESVIDVELAVKVFGSAPEDINYGLQAFQLASYVSNIYSMKPSFRKPKILSLSNFPRNLQLKDNL